MSRKNKKLSFKRLQNKGLVVHKKWRMGQEEGQEANAALDVRMQVRDRQQREVRQEAAEQTTQR